jgi:hypothetical protein
MSTSAAASIVSQAQKLALYRNLIRVSKNYQNYNFREFALRRSRWGFRDHVNDTDANAIKTQYDYGCAQLAILKRQVLISTLYPDAVSVMEFGGSSGGSKH